MYAPTPLLSRRTGTPKPIIRSYELAAANGQVNTNNKWYTANLISQGHNTGVKIQIRLGGPAIGDQLVSAELYEDTNILLGYVGTDQAIQLSPLSRPSPSLPLVSRVRSK